MENLGKQTVRMHVHHIIGGEHDPNQNHVNEGRQTVYRRADGTYLINYMGGKRPVTLMGDGAFEYVWTVRSGISVQTLGSVVDGMMSPTLKTVLELDSGDRWAEIDSDQGARYAGGLTQTAIGVFYEMEQKAEGRHPRRWFVLVGPDDAGVTVGKVCLCVLPEGEVVRNPDMVSDCHTTGRYNRNPYPEFAAEIEALADATDLPIIPNHGGQAIDVAPRPQGRGTRM
ncbi:hypothetical protein [Rhizobium sp. BK176]|uniref:hypothetical protein n=1 Tax=Rhizobium sp. BK176 TaxID=2587071 RepID=UPI0021696579|nr:hypothetical protein [Rhizobium sp. BK176]MCS4089225.1 hypothetical protein [Rhizobium sp. BK176]